MAEWHERSLAPVLLTAMSAPRLSPGLGFLAGRSIILDYLLKSGHLHGLVQQGNTKFSTQPSVLDSCIGIRCVVYLAKFARNSGIRTTQ